MDQAENLRNIIRQQNQNSITNARVIAVTSGKGGVGKSNLSVNLALEFTRMGKKVIILDADFGLANVEVMFGVIPEYNLSDLMFKGKEIKDIITEGPEGVGFISVGSGIANLVNLDQEQIKRLVNKLSDLEALADIIIIDTGAGISPSVMEFLLSSPETIIVTTPEPTVVTQFLGINMEYLGSVPQDSTVRKAVMKQKPVTIVYPNSFAARHFRYIAEELLGNEGDAPMHKKGIRSYFKNVFSRKM